MQKLIVFSGLDGAGKSTQIELLQAEFQKRGVPVTYIWSRGGYTPIFNALKSIARRLSSRRLVPASGHSEQRTKRFARPMVQKIWLVIAILDLWVTYAIWLRWLMLSGNAIICDRYIRDTQIDFRLNFPDLKFERWLFWKLLVASTPKANAAFLLLIPVEESMRRSNLKAEPFPDSRETLDSRLRAYQKLVSEEHWQVLDGCQPIEELSMLIHKKVFAE